MCIRDRGVAQRGVDAAAGEGPPADLTLADDAAAACEHLGLRSVVAVGFSMGFPVALELYRRHRHLVAGLVSLAGPSGRVLASFQGTQAFGRLLPLVLATTRIAHDLTARVWRKFLPSQLSREIGLRSGQVNAERIEAADLELIPVPYLLDYRVERKVYQEQVGDVLRGIHIAPHVPRVLALWGVMTRLRPPDPAGYSAKLQPVLSRLTPLDKADLFAYGRVPAGLTSDEARELLAAVPTLVVAGARDSFVPLATMRALAFAIPRVQWKVYPDATHALPAEYPLEIARELLEFVDGTVEPSLAAASRTASESAASRTASQNQ